MIQSQLISDQNYQIQYHNDENKFSLYGALTFNNVEKYNELFHFIYNNAEKINSIITID